MEKKNNIISRPDSSTEYDDELSLGHLLFKQLSGAGEKTLLICGLTGKTLSAIELLEQSVEVAKALLAADAKQGDVVSIVTENRFEFPIVLIGTILINCIFAPLNHTYSEGELVHAMNLSKPKFIFVSAAASQNIVNVVKSLQFVKKVVLLDNDDATNNEIVTKDFLKSQKVEFELKAVDKSSTIYTILCSSGTVGLPKGVQYSQANMIAGMRQAKYAKFIDEEHVILGFLPLAHAFGLDVLARTIATLAGKIVLLPRFNEETFLGCIERYRCNLLFLVPPLMKFLAKSPKVEDYDLSSLRFIQCGASHLSLNIEQELIERLSNENLKVTQAFGMTETCCVTLQMNIIKPGSIGDVNLNVQAKVIDQDGKALGPNETGEVCFKGPRLMVGYVNDPEATRSTIDNEGWVHSGDIAYYDEDLQFFIVDRIKDLIKYKGFQVQPTGKHKRCYSINVTQNVISEIEALLMTHPMISDCGVIGKVDSDSEELPLAFVVKSNSELTESDVIEFVSQRISPPKRLRGGVIFVNEIPKNPAGKILRRVLKKMLSEIIKSAETSE